MDNVQKNKIIAEFMGYKIDNSFPDKNRVYRLGNSIEMDNTFKYDLSYEWLMRVVNKIQSLEKTPPPNYTGYRFEIVIGGYVLIEGIPMHRIMKNVSLEGGTMNAIYEAVVEFIQNYNK